MLSMVFKAFTYTSSTHLMNEERLIHGFRETDRERATYLLPVIMVYLPK